MDVLLVNAEYVCSKAACGASAVRRLDDDDVNAGTARPHRCRAPGQRAGASYLKEDRALRTEVTFNDSYDFEIGQSIENLSALHTQGDEINARLLEVEAGAEEAPGRPRADRSRPHGATGDRRIPALRFGDMRVMALYAALVAIAHQAAGFSNAQLRRIVAALLEPALGEYTSAQMTYDLGRLAGHGLIARLPASHRYRLTPFGLRVAALCTALADRVLDPAIARCRDAPPSAPGTPWRRLEAALDAILERATIAA